MTESLTKFLNITIVIFMVGSLLEMGLKLRLNEAKGAFRNMRFIAQTLIWCFVVGPALAFLLTKMIPLAEPYALGLLFLGMAPCAPFLPKITEKAGGELAYVAAIMVLTAVGTIIFMPFAAPIMVKGFAADPWTIAKPLVLFIGLPMAAGVAIRRASEKTAEKAHPMVKKITDLDVLIMFILVFWLYGRAFFNMVGSYAIGTQLLYYAIMVAASYMLGYGLPPRQKSVLALGASTRNIGAAVAPLLAVPGTDERAIVMCILAAILAMIVGFGAAALMLRFASTGELVVDQIAGRGAKESG